MKRMLTLLPLAALALAACGSDDSVSIDDAWARATADGQTRGAIYFDLTVDDDDTLVAADVPASVAGEAQVHEVVPAETTDMSEMDDEMGDGMDESSDMAGSDDMDDADDMGEEMGEEMGDDMSDMDGMEAAMVMQELTDGLVLTGGETVTFEPGGYHVMLLDLVGPLEVGDEVELTLEFAEAGSTTLTVEVAESAP